MRKLGELLLGTVLVLTITGIIPALLVALMEKSVVLTIFVGIVAVLWSAYELCKE